MENKDTHIGRLPLPAALYGRSAAKSSKNQGNTCSPVNKTVRPACTHSGFLRWGTCKQARCYCQGELSNDNQCIPESRLVQTPGWRSPLIVAIIDLHSQLFLTAAHCLSYPSSLCWNCRCWLTTPLEREPCTVLKFWFCLIAGHPIRTYDQVNDLHHVWYIIEKEMHSWQFANVSTVKNSTRQWQVPAWRALLKTES